MTVSCHSKTVTFKHSDIGCAIVNVLKLKICPNFLFFYFSINFQLISIYINSFVALTVTTSQFVIST